MLMPFDKLSSNLSLKRSISAFVSNKVVINQKKQQLTTIGDLNEVNLNEIAQNWFLHETTNSIYKKQQYEEIIKNHYNQSTLLFLYDVSRYIDKQIPKLYAKYQNENITVSRIRNDIISEYNYRYLENMNVSELYYKAAASEKQIKYLLILAEKNKLNFYPKGMTKSEASKCIDYLKSGATDKAPVCFDKYFNLANVLMKTSEDIALRFKAFANAIEKMDFSKMDITHYYDIRNVIIDISGFYNIEYTKFDCCDDVYYIQDSLFIGDKSKCYCIAFEFDYFDLSIENMREELPAKIANRINGITTNEIINEIEHQIRNNLDD